MKRETKQQVQKRKYVGHLCTPQNGVALMENFWKHRYLAHPVASPDLIFILYSSCQHLVIDISSFSYVQSFNLFLFSVVQKRKNKIFRKNF